MNRAFDYKTSWLDLEGKPLIGRITFYKLHTTEKENIVDYNGNPLSNPIFTNTIGQPINQVFLLEKKDYTIYFEKYVGTEDRMTDQDNWLFQYSCDDLWDTYSVDIVSSSYQIVNNIGDLRNLDPSSVAEREGKKIVALGGYNQIADKPIVLYVWNPTLIEENDNGGSIIKVNDIASGRWELINNFVDGLDVRHFGVFGTDSYEDATDQMSLQIGVANTYATSIGVPLLFPAIDGITWYKINNLVLTKTKWMNNTRVFGNSNTTSTINVYDEDQYLDCYKNDDYNAHFVIVSPNVRTSWGENAGNCEFRPTYKLIVDSLVNTRNRTFENVIIECQTGPIEDAYFYGCVIESAGKLGDNCRFKDCTITESMFSPLTNFSTISIISNVQFDLGSFSNVDNWLWLEQQVNTDCVLDLRGRTLNADSPVNWVVSTTYKNANFDGFIFKQQNVVLYNCTGSAYSTNLKNFSAFETTLQIVDYGDGQLETYTLADSTIFLNTPKSITNCTALRSTIGFNDNQFIVNCAMDFSILNSNIRVQTCNVKDTTLNGSITTSISGFYFQNCLFNAQHIVNVVMSNSVVNGTWMNNVGTIANPITFNITTGAFADSSLQNYVYLNNSGTFLPTTAKKEIVKTSPNIENYIYSTGITYPQLGNVGFYTRDSVIKVICPNVNAELMPLFNIGDNATFVVKIKTFLDVTYNGIPWHPNYEYFKYTTGNTPDANWINGYQLVPQFETYIPNVGTTTVNGVRFIIEIEKI